MEESAYRRCERRYSVRRVALNAKQTKFARQDPELDDGEVLDFASPNIDADPRVRRLGPHEADMRGLLQLGHGGGGESSTRVYAVRDRPGVYYIPRALGARAQARWARTCLARFSMCVRRGDGVGRLGLYVGGSPCMSFTHTCTGPGTPT